MPKERSGRFREIGDIRVATLNLDVRRPGPVRLVVQTKNRAATGTSEG